MSRGKAWSDEDNRRLIALRATGQRWAETCKQFPDRGEKSIYVHYAQIMVGNIGTKKSWTPIAILRLQRMIDVERKSFTECDRALGRPSGSCHAKYRNLQKQAAAPPKRIVIQAKLALPTSQQPPWTIDEMQHAAGFWLRHFTEVYGYAASREARNMVLEALAHELDRTVAVVRRRLEIHGVRFGLSTFNAERATRDMLAAREARRAAADRRDLTATFCGDPPPGYSALDGRQSIPESKRINNNRVAPVVTLPSMEMTACGPTLQRGTNP